MVNEYIVKCDDCKKTIKENVGLRESAEGGRCEGCKEKVELWRKVDKESIETLRLVGIKKD